MAQGICKGVSLQDVQSASTTNAKKDLLLSLLMQISENQNQLLQQQDQFQQQLEDCQASHQQHTLHQQVEALHSNLLEKMCTMDTVLANVQQSLSRCIGESVKHESLRIQEQVVMMKETVPNDLCERMRLIMPAAKAGSVSQQFVIYDTSLTDTAEKTVSVEDRECHHVTTGGIWDRVACGHDSDVAVLASGDNQEMALSKKIVKPSDMPKQALHYSDNKDDVLEQDRDDVLEQDKDDVLEQDKDGVLEQDKDDVLEQDKDDILEQDKDGVLEQDRDDVLEQDKDDILEQDKDGVLEKDKDGVLEQDKDGVLEKDKDGVLEQDKDGVLEKDKDGVLEQDKDGVLEKDKDGVLEKDKDGVLEQDKDGVLEQNRDDVLEQDKDDVLRQTLHYELNAFLAIIQELMLKPISTDELSIQLTDTMSKLLLYERCVSSNYFHFVQTAVNTEVSARIDQMEMFIRQEIERNGAWLENNGRIKLTAEKVYKQIYNIKKHLSSKLVTKIVSELKQESVPETKYQGDNFSQPCVNSQLEKVDRSDHASGPVISGGNDTVICPENIRQEQVHTVALMLGLHVLALLFSHDILVKKQTLKHLENADSNKTRVQPLVGTVLTCQSLSAEANQMSANTHSDRDKTLQETAAVPRVLTCEQVTFQEQRTEVHFKCDFYYDRYSNKDEISMFELEDIPPGYSLKLTAKMLTSRQHKLNLFVMSMDGEMTDRLVWPANFMLTLSLGDQDSLGGPSHSGCHRCSQVVTISKPKLTGKSVNIRVPKGTSTGALTHVCFFSDETIQRFVVGDTLCLTVSVMHVGNVNTTT